MKRIDLLIGSKYGEWLVLSRVESKNHGSRWNCKCSCGSIREVQQQNLLKGLSTKCRACCKQAAGESAFHSIIKAYKESAKVRSLEYALSEEKVRSLITSDCAYCGCEPSLVRRIKGCHGSFTFNGIDRKDSSLGYTEDNSVPCCKTCNYMKRSMSVEDFIAHVQRVAEYLG